MIASMVRESIRLTRLNIWQVRVPVSIVCSVNVKTFASTGCNMINSVTLGNWTIIYNHKKARYEAHRPDQEPVIGWDIIDVCHDAGTTNPTLDEYAALLRLQEKSDVVKPSTVDSTIVSMVHIGRGDGEGSI